MDKRCVFVRMTAVLCAIAAIFCIPLIFCACRGNNTYSGELLRLHIRANSDSAADQAVKLKVRDRVNEYLYNNIAATSFAAAYADVALKLNKLESIADGVLKENGFNYGARARLGNEYFPTRMYGDTEVPEGYYDALIIELGAADGNNWWCVVYPPLCYGDNFAYRSIIAELFA